MSPVPENLEQRVIEIIAKKKKLDPTTITPGTTFEQLGIDSLDAADLLFTFEDTFGIVVPDQAALTMRSVGQVIDGVRLLLEAGPTRGTGTPTGTAGTPTGTAGTPSAI